MSLSLRGVLAGILITRLFSFAGPARQWLEDQIATAGETPAAASQMDAGWIIDPDG